MAGVIRKNENRHGGQHGELSGCLIMSVVSGRVRSVVRKQIVEGYQGVKMIDEMIVVPVRISAVDFWSNILGSGWESCEWWTGIEYGEGSDWDKVGTITLTGWDEVSEEGEDVVKTKTLNLQDLVDAYTNCLAQGYKFNVEDFDVYDGDAVIQMAFYGEVVYG